MTKSAPRLHTKRKYVERVIKEPKRYIYPLTGNLVLRPTCLRAAREKKRRDNVWLDTQRKVEKMSLYMEKKEEKKMGTTMKLPIINMTLFDARNYELDFVDKRNTMFTKGSSFASLLERRMESKNSWKSVSNHRHSHQR